MESMVQRCRLLLSKAVLKSLRFFSGEEPISSSPTRDLECPGPPPKKGHRLATQPLLDAGAPVNGQGG